ncbi:hypothetical protein LCL97_08975 [Seohaeicola saemankumensis]|nr:hypothetical protein [Seohaeicola saemankumensis]MCA0870956.1 hypothetical protein [Seohaeicola saemankumensis]
MQDKTINGALLALRKQIIRGNLDGLSQVETLLQLRGVQLPRVMPAKRSDVARRGQMRIIILDALRGGPKRLPEIAAHVVQCRPDADTERAYKRVSVVLTKMKAEGLVRHEGRVWRLAP